MPSTCTLLSKKRSVLRLMKAIVLGLFFFNNATAQICPPNIDFESGSFSNWTCYTGNVVASNGTNVITLSPSGGPVGNVHTMISAAGGGIDPFGGFPMTCPNGSGHSIKLGNNIGGNRAEGVSYEFTIPSNQNTYSLVYHYAVVFQDPRHETYQQPRLEIEAKNITDNEVIYCSSFTFYPVGSILPGFFISPLQQDTTNVWCKDWAAVTLNLNNKAGKTIRLFFKTADCTFQRHFGYAYIDVDSDCSSEFVGASYCRGDTTVNVTGPFGYQNYTWFSNNFAQVIGTTQTVNFTPPPPVGTSIAVEVVPYDGYGCKDTFFAVLLDTLQLRPDAGRDALSCNQTPVQIGSNPKSGVVYNWSPSTGLNSAVIANPRASPSVTTTYVLSIRSAAGGCAGTDTVTVEASFVDTTLNLLGKDAYCITSGDSSVLTVPPALSIQWYRNNSPISGATGTRYKATQSGAYRAELRNARGCSVSTSVKDIFIDAPLRPERYPALNAVENISMPLQARNIGLTAKWDPIIFLDDPLIFNPKFKGISDQLYTISITSRAGCVTVDTQLVKVFKEINFYVPSAFTPNNDGLNDYLFPVPTGIVEFRYFRIFNRWGVLLYEMRTGEQGWNGMYKGIPQGMQNVVWMAEGVGADGRVHRKKGTTILLR